MFPINEALSGHCSSSSSSGIPRHLSQPLPINPKYHRGRQPNHNANKPQQTIPPPIIQLPIQVRGKKREPESRQTAQHHGRSKPAGRKAGVTVDDVHLHALETDDGSRAEDGHADVGHDPVDPGLDTPAVPEEADGDERRAGEHQGDAEFRSPDVVVVAVVVVVFLSEMVVDAIAEVGADLGPEKVSHAEGDVVQAADADVLVVDVAPDLGESGQDEVEQAEEVGHVQRDDLDDWLGGQETEWTNQCGLEDTEDSLIGVIALKRDSQFGCFSFQQDRCVGLPEEEKSQDLNDDCGYASRPEYPSPGGCLGDEASCDGSHGRSKKRSKTVDTNGFSSPFRMPAITGRKDITG
jgi:hypothetical protein